ncbi:UNVERIFIED_CONTAM: hypothetical protein H355_005966 [Colinus virginianus]|nr:hypothetical protein H355_005966 [Colinus virginianus]
MLERKERGGEAAGPAARGLPAVRSTLQQCGLLQDLIDISLSNLRGLRTKCAASNDLTQQEIRTLEQSGYSRFFGSELGRNTHQMMGFTNHLLCFAAMQALFVTMTAFPKELNSLLSGFQQVKLIDYIHRQRQCKLSVPLHDRTAELNSYPRFNDWLDIVNVRKEVVQRIPEELTLDALLEMNESKVKETMKRCGARDEECSRLNGALSCLRKVTESDNLLDPFAFPAHSGRLTPRTPHSITITPPATPQAKRRHKLKPPRTPPPPCRKVFQLLPNFPTLTRSKSHESQLGNRIDDVPPIKSLYSPSELSQGSPQMVRRDFGLAVTHRFSTKSWLSQICQVCQKSMMFGVK